MINLYSILIVSILAIPAQIFFNGSVLASIEYLYYTKRMVNIPLLIIFIFLSFIYDYFYDIPLGIYQLSILVGLMLLVVSEKFLNLENIVTKYLIIFASLVVSNLLLKVIVNYNSFSTIVNIIINNFGSALIGSIVTLVIYIILEKIDTVLNKESKIGLKIKNK